MNEKLALKIAELLLRGMAILVWYAIRGDDKNDAKEKNMKYLNDVEHAIFTLKVKGEE